MTIQAVAWVLDYSRSRAIDRLVLIAMANNDNDGIVGVSKATLAREAGDISEASVWRSWKALQSLGEIAPYDGEPKWWLELPSDRRPRLWALCGYLAFHAERGRDGVATGSRQTRPVPIVPKSQRTTTSRSATPQPSGRFRGELEIWRAGGGAS